MNKCECCGAKRDLKSQVCPYCGVPYPIQQPINNAQQNNYPIDVPQAPTPEQLEAFRKKKNVVSLFPGIIMFFILPPFGLALILITILINHKRSKKQ